MDAGGQRPEIAGLWRYAVVRTCSGATNGATAMRVFQLARLALLVFVAIVAMGILRLGRLPADTRLYLADQPSFRAIMHHAR